MFFLQTIEAPIFGSNGPMWSLANEFWYYILAPLSAFLVFSRSSASLRIVLALVLGGLIWFLPFLLLQAGLIWLAGAFAANLLLWAYAKRAMLLWPIQFVILIVPLAMLAGTKIPQSGIGDFHLGISVALALPVLSLLPPLGAWYSLIAGHLAGISFTLYVTHFPLLTLVAMVGFAPRRFDPGLLSFSLFFGLVLLAFCWSVIMWFCFERHTDRVSAFLGLFLIRWSRAPNAAASKSMNSAPPPQELPDVLRPWKK